MNPKYIFICFMSNKEEHPLKDIIEATKTQNIMLINLICEDYDLEPEELKKIVLRKNFKKENIEIFKQVQQDTTNEYMNNSNNAFIEIVSTKRFIIDGKETIKKKIKTYKALILGGILYLKNTKTGIIKPA